MNKKICIIGAGTYGSYLANAIAEKYPSADIHLLEVGNGATQSESQIGFFSKDKNGRYKATSDGRYFGLGGTSAKWGGQLLFFSNKDFADPAGMRSIIDFNLKYREKVLSRFFPVVPDLEEKDFGGGLFSKPGIWLKFSQRNIFTHFQLHKKQKITVHQNARVIKLNSENGVVKSVAVQFSPAEAPVDFEADVFYLTSGAFESLRLMSVSGLMDMQTGAGFSDHISMRSFHIHSSNAKIGSQDFQFRFENGSMITSRLIGEKDHSSYFIQPIFNEGLIVFQFIKQLLFKGKFSPKMLVSAFTQFFHLFPFAYTYLFRKKLYVYKSWFLNIDMELSKSANKVNLSEESDRYQQKGISIEYTISEDTVEKLKQIKKEVAEMLKRENIPFTEVSDNVSSIKLEDTYHPYKLFGSGKDILEAYHPLANLYLINTGLLQRAGGINPSAALFCLIEYHVEEGTFFR
jgi:hypothetical protein